MIEDQHRTAKKTIEDQIHLLSIAEGFYASRVLFALLRLKIFQLIGQNEKRLDEIAQELGASVDALQRLLNAGVTFELLESDDGNTFRLSACSKSVLVPGQEGFLGDWIGLLDGFNAALSDLDKVVLGNEPVHKQSDYLSSEENERAEIYTMAMHSYAATRGKELNHYLDTSGCKSLLDIGCGPGTYAFHLGMQNPELKLYLLDAPAVLEVAKKIREQYALENEIHYLPRDERQHKIPGTYDMILASNVLHVLDDHIRDNFIKQLFEVTNPGGSLVVQAQFLNEDRNSGRWAVLLDLNLLCTTKQGRNHTVEETKKWLSDAGYENIEYCAMSVFGTSSFIRGFKSG